MNQPSLFVATIDLGLAEKLIQDLISQGFEITKPQYTVFSGRKPGITCTLYQSGKLTVQGREMAPFVEFYLEPEILKKLVFTHQEHLLDKTARIGVDESGKGDFYGPLCIAGVFAGGSQIGELKALGVKDSKNITDAGILELGRKIRTHFKFHVIRLLPLKYNELYLKFRNLNHLLAWGHASIIEALVESTTCRTVIIDQFANERVVIDALSKKKLDVELTQRHRAEEDLVVAAASILAREAFLLGLKLLSEQFDVKLPKGGSSPGVISAGKQFLAKHGKENFPQVAKMHFKTLDSIILKESEFF